MPASFTDWDRDPNYLAHFGTKGMKWGQRRYQNPDGSLTAAGRARYGVEGKRSARGMTRDLNKLDKERANAQYRASRYAKKIARKDARYAKKLARAESSGKTKKAAKLLKEREGLMNTHAGKRATKYSELLRRNQDMTNKILERANQQGMTVKTRRTARMVNKGRGLAKGLAFAGAATAGYAALQGHMANKGLAGVGVGKVNIKAKKGIAQRIYDYGSSMRGSKLDIGKGISLDRVGKFAQKHAGKLGVAALGAQAVGGGTLLGKTIGTPRVRGTKYKVKKRK